MLNIGELKILPQRFVFFIFLIFSAHAILLKGVDLVTCNRLQWAITWLIMYFKSNLFHKWYKNSFANSSHFVLLALFPLLDHETCLCFTDVSSEMNFWLQKEWISCKRCVLSWHSGAAGVFLRQTAWAWCEETLSLAEGKSVFYAYLRKEKLKFMLETDADALCLTQEFCHSL